MDDLLPPRLVNALAVQGGVFTTAQALDFGLDQGELRRLVRRRVLVRLRRGAYALASDVAHADPVARHVLAVRATHLSLAAEHVVSHVSAAAVHALPLVGVGLAEVHVTGGVGARSTRRESSVWHHRGEVPADDRVELDGLPVTSLARTAFDVARIVSGRSALVVADAALRAGATADQLRQQLDARRDWPGSRRASRALLMADGRAESPGESLARWAFAAVGLPPDDLQFEILTDEGVYRTDFAWRKQRVVGEFDGRVKYGRLLRAGEQASDVAWRERRRELAIERTEHGVVRFTWTDAFDLSLVRARLLQSFARQSGRRSA